MKLSMSASPSAPVTKPIRKAPTSSTIEPLNRISRQSPASMRAAPSPRETSHSADRIAGASMMAATATM